VDQTVKQEFGSRLRRLRKAKKMTARELGEKLGVAESTIIGYENGVRSPNLQQLSEIARIFNVTTDFLVSDNADELRDLKQLLETKDINYNGYKLNEAEIEQAKNFLEFLIVNKLNKTETAE
jgi:transcriptional regulator with XRE-family HTH domain